MKPILTLCAQPLFDARGSPIRVLAFLRALGRAGVPVKVVTLPFGAEAALPDPVRIHRVPNIPGVRSVAIGPSFAKLVFGFLIAFRALFAAVPRRCSTVHGIEEMGLPAWGIARLTGARFVFEKHSDPASHRTGSRPRDGVMGAYRAVERFVCRRADVVIATGPGLGGQARSYGGRGRVRVIDDVPSSDREPDPARTRRWRERLPAGRAGVVFAYIGSFAAYQGVPLFLEAVRRALPGDERLRVVLVGGAEQSEAIRRLGEEGGFADRLLHIPSIPPDEVPDFLAACDVLVSPRLEGSNTPLKVLDYLRAGRCILATDTEANRLVLDAETARLVAPTAEALAGAMGALAGDGALRRSLGSRGRERFDERFGFDRFRDCLLEVFREPGDPDRGGRAA
ncbi:MAG: glycosyltransferase [Puniceicoccaceae bacterium]